MKIGSMLMLALAMMISVQSCKKAVYPTASFTYSPATVTQYEAVQFTSTSSNADTYAWDFGDGNVITDANPTVTFLTAGNVTVKLTVTI